MTETMSSLWLIKRFHTKITYGHKVDFHPKSFNISNKSAKVVIYDLTYI